MAEIKGGKLFQQNMAALAHRVKSASVLRVGFLDGATYPDGTSVAAVAAIQNFGAPAAGIPPRPFFSNLVREAAPEWAGKLKRILEANEYDADKSLALLGLVIEGELREAIIDTNAPPLKPATVRRKGFAKPLIDTGQMLNSISSEVDA